MRPLLASALILVSTTCFSLENWQFSGFGSIGVGKVNRDNFAFGEADENWDFDNDTRLGIQLQGNISERLSFTTQVSSSGLSLGDSESYDPQLQWLFLSYEAGANLQLRLGRMRSSHYIYSGTRDVGYSYPWARPPIDVYAYLLQPLGNIDGADLLYTMDMHDDLELDIQLFAGKVDGTIRDVYVESNPTYGTSLTLRSLDWLIRYSFHIEHTDISSDSLQQAVGYYDEAYALTGDPAFQEIAFSLYAKGTNYQYHAIGGQWDLNRWGLIAEKYWIIAPDEGFANDSEGWYVSAFYQFEQLTPYAVVSAYDNTLNKDTIALINETLPNYPSPPYPASIGTLLSGTQSILQSFKAQQQSYTVGIRYDFMPKWCLKGEAQFFDFKAGSTGQGYPLTDGPRPKNATLFTIVLDMVF